MYNSRLQIDTCTCALYMEHMCIEHNSSCKKNEWLPRQTVHIKLLTICTTAKTCTCIYVRN